MFFEGRKEGLDVKLRRNNCDEEDKWLNVGQKEKLVRIHLWWHFNRPNLRCDVCELRC